MAASALSEAWRRRYGAEFAALLEEEWLTPAVVFDGIVGALDARLRPQIQGRRVGRLTSEPAWPCVHARKLDRDS